MPQPILLANPRGFCAGVDRAISIVERALEEYGAPIYVRHEVVHNKFVVDDLRNKGAIFIEELSDVPEGSTLIYSAHGVSLAVQEEAVRRGFRIFDATCPLVTKVHKQVQRLNEDGYQIIMIGHKGHPEVEGTMGQVREGGMLLVEVVEDVAKLVVDDVEKLAHVSQTTLSVDETFDIIEALKARFPHIKSPNKEDICYATTNRQEAVKDLAKENGLTAKVAEQVVQQSANVIAREVEVVQKKAEIKHAEAEVEYKNIVAEAHNDAAKVAEAKVAYEVKNQQIEEDFKKEVATTVETKTKELIQQSTENILKKAEDKKKNTVEDDVRARLRGFARTIPSFLMAYSDPSTTLASFDTTIKDEVFKEVTGITLDQFRTLRDTYNFFDAVVFDESVQEFLRKRAELANYFDESQEEDIFDYIPPQQTNQIFTPKKVVKMMIDKLQEESPEDFTNPDKTFVDLYIKSGLYIAEIVKRLYVGLEDKIPDENERLKHILEHQIYGFAPSEIIYNIACNFIFGFDEKAKNIDASHVVYLDTTPFARGEVGMSFEDKCDELFGKKL